MTEEEYRKLPSCLRYKNPNKDCHHINSDDWDELEDCCQNCTGFPHFARKYWSGFMDQSYEEVIKDIEQNMLKLIKDNKTKTFYTEMDINYFLGVYKPDIRNEQICESTYIKICEKYKAKMLWDD